MKKCISCHAKKPDNLFSQVLRGKNKGLPGKVCDVCRDKRKAYGVEHSVELKAAAKEKHAQNRENDNARGRSYHWANRDTLLQKKRTYWAMHRDEANLKKKIARAENPEHFREIARLSRARNKEKISIRQIRYHEQHRPELITYAAKYRTEHKIELNAYDRIRAKTPKRIAQMSDAMHRRRTRINGTGHVEKVDRFSIYKRDGGRCHICQRHVPIDKFHLDHLIPISAGGSHTRSNVAIAHPICNLKRGKGYIPAQLLLIDS